MLSKELQSEVKFSVNMTEPFDTVRLFLTYIAIGFLLGF